MMRLLGSYIFWSYERGSVQYDVMVTAILLFIFVGPRFIDFKDKPVTTVPIRASEVLVKNAANGDLTYELRVEDLGNASTDDERRAAIKRVIEPISGDVKVESYRAVVDTKGKVVAYDATVKR
ncbi:MAG TPA: hypothetical protein VFC39_02535 [Acidobacteriaceae bacterium]|nr:hypothetical protein [Acidobacteriaceae bacterium]